MTETDGAVSEGDYVEFLVRCADAALARDCRVLVLTHDTADRAIAAPLGADLGERVSMLNMPDAIHAKALIGGAALVISSRYHGLVNALSSACPRSGQAGVTSTRLSSVTMRAATVCGR